MLLQCLSIGCFGCLDMLCPDVVPVHSDVRFHMLCGKCLRPFLASVICFVSFFFVFLLLSCLFAVVIQCERCLISA